MGRRLQLAKWAALHVETPDGGAWTFSMREPGLMLVEGEVKTIL